MYCFIFNKFSGGSWISCRGAWTSWGVDYRGGYVSQILYVEMKESGPLGGRAPGMPPLDPPMINIVQ